MGKSFAEATGLLLAGKSLAWAKYKDYKAGSITLDKPEQRRLLEFLLVSDPDKVAAADESLFAGLFTAWQNTGHDPATTKIGDDAAAGSYCWRLYRVEASGFGGLTAYGGKPFDLYVGGHNWCLEGQNGSGKTSLVSAILWALTGKRIRDHDGPVDDCGEREPVENNDGIKIGEWPPLASYPTKIADLGKDAEVWVRLTFQEEGGASAIAFRRVVSPARGEPQLEKQIDDRLSTALRLAEIGILMPSRLPKIGFGKHNSLTLYEAVKQLTGLDQLATIADGCAAFGAANRRFMKYAKDNGIDKLERAFSDNMAGAAKLAEEFDFALPATRGLGENGLDEHLQRAAKAASDAAGQHLTTLKTEIPASLDVATVEGRNAIKTAVSSARGILTQGLKTIPLFQAWKALSEAPNDPALKKLSSVLATAKVDLQKGLDWHARQAADHKLRLKALAAQSFIPALGADPSCPLCSSPLDNAEKRKLARELEELKNNADAAERKIADVCRGLQETITASLPAALRNARTTIDTMDPRLAYVMAMKERFVVEAPFATVLTGIAAVVGDLLDVQSEALPRFSYPEFQPTDAEPEEVVRLRRDLHALERLFALVQWWSEERLTFVDAWTTLIGQKQEDGTFPDNSIEGKLRLLEQALDQARPLDDLSKLLSQAAKSAKSWTEVMEVQKTREAIKDALDPLKSLRALVISETASTIADLSGTMNAICERIRLNERLAYEEAVLGKKEVTVTGSFSAGIRIDAALVANASWLRAILWSFIFALREQTLRNKGFNPLPLVVLDDPQATFDPRNKRKWAQELVRCANLPATDLFRSQLIVTTHERNFYQMMIDHERFNAQQGLIGCVNKISGVATVANGGELERVYRLAKDSNDDAAAREYIRKVRIYCEDLIKFMLRSISNKVSDMTLNELKDELKRLGNAHVAPFDRKAFQDVINALNESQKAIQYLNNPHHRDDETYGVAEAETVSAYWKKPLLDRIHTAFGVFDTFELYTGEPRTFPWAKNVIAFPDGYRTQVKSAEMFQTGIAAAAKTDGRAGDGAITIEEWSASETVFLPNHEVFQLTAGTLDPVAGVGDLIVVSNYAKINPRNLVVAVSGGLLLARRYNRPENHSEIVVLTGQAVDPYALPLPIIVQPDTNFRKIVGTLFTSHLLPVSAGDPEHEFVSVPDPSILEKTLKGSRLFKVDGRSAEPIALEGQFLITREKPSRGEAINKLDGRLIVGIDEDGARYFKRLRCRGTIAILESLNPDGSTAAEVLSLDGSHSLPKIAEAIEVVGVLFEEPNACRT